uniref:Ubiquitin-like modifier-activating enzyme 5 n=1 Tax=Schistocephalus solidus TaxID=70667 RepID=A0A0X3NZV8_SCHSO
MPKAKSTKVSDLKAEIAKLRSELSKSRPGRDVIDQMSSEVVSSNPYSRLMALQKMGIVDNYAQIREKSVAVIGVGGVGSVASEMLTRCGIGRLILFDYDKVELANMNRLFFQPHQAGLSKVEAAAATLRSINPDVRIQVHNYDITLVDNYENFMNALTGTENAAGPVDLVLSCVDNFEARMTINKACNELNQVWFEAGVSEDALNCHFQLMYPGRTPCFECMPPLVVASGLNDTKVLKRDGVCAASLPTTMAIVAGLMVQNVLKFLLSFGEVTSYFGYGAAKDTVYRVCLKPNPACADSWCRKRQTDRRVQLLSRGLPEDSDWDAELKIAARAEIERLRAAAETQPLHAENEFQIELVEEGGEESSAATVLPTGDLVTSGGVAAAAEGPVVDTNEESLEDLMNRMRQLK